MPLTFTFAPNFPASVNNTATFPPLSFGAAWAPPSTTYGSGNSAGQVDRLHQSPQSATTVGVSLNIRNGSLLNVDSSAANFAHVSTVGFVNTDNTNSVTIAGDWITTAFGGSITLGPGETFIRNNPAGWTVTASTADTITLTSSAGTAAVQVVLVGRSA